MNRHEVDATEAESVNVGRFARTLERYRTPILVSLAAVICGYIILAAFVLVISPTLTVTSLPFRLTFEGAERGSYPNGLVFSSNEIVAQPVLARVWASNNLKEYMPLDVFVRSVYILEANPVMEQLASDYQARLADPKLSPIDRERLIREFETKKASISKSEYSLNISPPNDDHRLPDALARKVLNDVLREWAEHATKNQRVLQYGIPVMSPTIVPPVSDPSLNFVARLQVLRSNIFRVVANLNSIQDLPGGTLARTRADQLTLQDIRTQLEDMMRFRLEPLVPVICASGLVPNRAEAIRFTEMQLAFDERQLVTARESSMVIRQAIVTYTNANDHSLTMDQITQPDAPDGERQSVPGAVTPLLGETFLERVMQMGSAAADLTYRQKLIDEYRSVAGRMPALQQAVAYDREVLSYLRATAGGTSGATAQQVEQQINAMHREVHEALRKMNELYATISQNLAPDTHMYAATGVPTTRTQRRMDPVKLGALGLLIVFLALPMILIAVLIHSRMRQDNARDDRRDEPLEAA